MESNDKLAVSTYLREWRLFRNMTQEQLATEAGTTPPAISQLENGRHGFTDKSLAAYAKALQCSPAALLAFDPRRPDSFWPVIEAAERLQGRDRQRALAIMKVAIGPEPVGSE